MRIRSGHDFHRSVGHLSEVIARIRAIGWQSAPISDCSTFSYVQWTKLCKTANLRPVYGCEIGGWSFFAKEKLRPLNDLFSKPMTNDIARQAKGVIKVAGTTINLERIDQRSPDLYVALSPSTTRFQFQEAKRRGFRFIASSDNSYPTAAARDFYRVALGKRAALATYPQYILSDKEWREAVASLTDDKLLVANALKNRDAAMAQCNAALKPAKLLVPKKPKKLIDMCYDGAMLLGVDLPKRGNPNLQAYLDSIYWKRMSHELSVIEIMKNEDYFHIVADLMQYAKKHMTVGPGRGSAAGSLVCYLLGITSIDPLKFDLLFERFLDITRTELPDIDSDFPDTKRPMIFKYLQDKYGADHVAKVGNVNTFGPRSILARAGAALGIPKWECDAALTQLIVRSDGDARAFNTLQDTLETTIPGQKLLKDHPEIAIAWRMENHPNHSSTHAAGVLITKDPIAEHAAVDHQTQTAMLDLKDSEAIGALKVDCLGLSTLSVFDRTIELIG